MERLLEPAQQLNGSTSTQSGKRHPGDDEHLREYDVSICKVVVVAEYFWRNL